MEKKPILSISMLVSDRPDTIRRCLDSLKPIRERIPSELILVNTGKNQQVREIIKEYTDEIVDFEWCDDFAKARNAGLDKARGEWFLTLDDDEWFVNPQPLIVFFQSGEYKEYGCANYLVRNFYDPKYQYYSDAWVSRMIQISDDTHYESKIHEYLYPVKGDCKNIEALAYHSGYIFASEEERLAHFERNVRLLRKMIDEEPERLRWRVQLLQEYRAVHDYEHMYEDGMKCIELFRKIDNSVDNRDIGTFYVAAAEGKLFLKDEDEAYRIGALAIKDKRTSELCHAYVMLIYGVIFYRKKNWAEAEHAIKTYFQIQEYLKQNPKRLEIQQGALLVAEAFDEMALKKAYSILIVCGLKKQDTEPLKKYFKELGWEQNSVYLMDGFMKDVVEAMAHLKEDDFFVEVMRLVWNHPQLRNNLLGEAAPYEEHDPKGFARLAHYMAQLFGNHWYLWYAKIVDADDQASDSQFLQYVTKLVDSVTNIFCIPDKVIEKTRQRALSIEEAYLQISLEKWEQHWKAYMSDNGAQAIQYTIEKIHAMQTKPDIRYDLVDILEAEYGAFLDNESSGDYETMRQKMKQFANRTVTFTQKYPSEQKMLGEVAHKVTHALELEERNPKEAIQCMADLSKIVPEYALAIKKYLLAFNNYYQNKEAYTKRKLEETKTKIMGEVQGLVDREEYDSALAILEELKQIVPEDLDIAETILQTRILCFKKRG